jgi:hypothetical protein
MHTIARSSLRASRGIHDLLYPGESYCTTDLQLAVKKQFPQLLPHSVEERVPTLFPAESPVAKAGQKSFRNLHSFAGTDIATVTQMF